MKMILAVALALGGMSTSTAARAKDDPAAGANSMPSTALPATVLNAPAYRRPSRRLPTSASGFSPPRSRTRSGRAED